MIEKRDVYLVIAAAVLAINVVIGFHFYDVGKRKVALKATQDSLVTVEHEKAILSQSRDSIGKELIKADNKSAITRIIYKHDSANVQINGDSAYDSTGHFIQVLDKRITQRITSADKHVTKLEAQLKTAKYGFKIDTLFIAKQDQETGLNKSIASLTKGSRLSRGFQVGAGYCGTPKGSTPCIYAGYGISGAF